MAFEDGSSDPYSLLEFRTAKHASLATELHLGKMGITRLANFETFVSLDTLWLNDNRIRESDSFGLEKEEKEGKGEGQ